MRGDLSAALVGVPVSFLVPVSKVMPGGTPVAVQVRTLFPVVVALKAARAALETCRKNGHQAAVSVNDRAGNALVMLRDRFAGTDADGKPRLSVRVHCAGPMLALLRIAA